MAVDASLEGALIPSYKRRTGLFRCSGGEKALCSLVLQSTIILQTFLKDFASFLKHRLSLLLTLLPCGAVGQGQTKVQTWKAARSATWRALVISGNMPTVCSVLPSFWYNL